MCSDKSESQWTRLESLFDQALALPADEIDQFCENACGGDEELSKLLRELVTSADVDDEAIRESVAALARDVAQSSSLSGEMIGAYRVDELIGHGGMGEVYLASRADGQFDKKVAIKVVRHKLNQEEFVRHFQTERQVLATLHHPYIPVLIDAGQLDDGRPYFMAEYVQGVPIDVFCDKHSLPLKKRLELIEKLGEAVQHAHSMLALHLDIKPANVLVEANGTPRLLDFGVTRLMGDPDTGHKAFTPDYASPEQIRGERPTARSDVYSLGILAYRLLTGDEPFDGPRFAPSATKIQSRVELEERVKQLEPVTGLHPDLCAIIQKATAQSTSQRYSSIESLLADIKRYRNHLPVSARHKTFIYRSSKYLRRHAIAISVATIILGILTAFAIREIQLRKDAQSARMVANVEAESSRQIASFLINLFQISDPGEARGNSVTARELLDKGSANIAQELANQPKVATRLLRTMGNVYVKLGLNDQAISLFEQGLSMSSDSLSDDTTEQAQILAALGDGYTRLNRFDDAERVLQNALTLTEQVQGANSAIYATALSSLGTLYMRQGKYAESEQAQLRAVSIRETVHGPRSHEIALAFSSLARVYSDQGRNTESESFYLRAINILEEIHGEDYPHLAIELESLGNLYNQMQRYDDAVVYLKRGLASREKSLDPEHPMVSYSLMNIAALYTNQDKLDAAEPHLLRAVAIMEKIFEPDDYRLALCRYNLADLRFKRGEIDEAERLGLTALHTFEQKLGPQHRYIGFVSLLLGEISEVNNLPLAAEGYYQRAHDVFSPRPADDPVKMDMMKKFTEFLRAHGRADHADALEFQGAE